MNTYCLASLSSKMRNSHFKIISTLNFSSVKLYHRYTHPIIIPHSQGNPSKILQVTAQVNVSTRQGIAVNRMQTPFIFFRAWKKNISLVRHN